MRLSAFASLVSLSLAFLPFGLGAAGCAAESEETPSEENITTPQVYCAENSPCSIPSDLANPTKKFLRDNPRLYELRGGHKDFSTCVGYGEHVYDGDFTVSSAKVIQAIATSQPKDLWSGTSQYQLTYDRNTKKVYTRNDTHPPIALGMVFILTLKIAPLVYIPVAFEIVSLDPGTGKFAFSYVLQNKSQGIQALAFNDTAGGSHVVHETRFKSDSEFRDRNFYIYFHEKLLKEFYAALAKKLSTPQP